jgi:hypothetical protein
MSAADLRRAIELPAAASGLLLQPGLVQTMLKDWVTGLARYRCSRMPCSRHGGVGGG